mgnify:FL=1
MNLGDKLFFAFLKWSFIYFLIAVILPIVIHYYIYKFEYNVKKEKNKRNNSYYKKSKKALRSTGKHPVKQISKKLS